MHRINNQVEFITYIGGDAYSAPVVLKSDGTTQNYLYLHRDYQGSIVAISNQSGVVVEKRLFDAWGELLRVQDQQGNILTGLTVLDRGYTGHEHLQSVGLIHMNGRLYDAKLHRFLQPDNYIQDPYNTQNYNRYGYVLNNPLKYTDPSGELIGIGTAILIGAIISATSYTLTALLADVPFSAAGFLKASFIGALSGAISFGIGNMVQTLPIAEKIIAGAILHGSSQGIMTGLQGGDALSAFVSGAVSSIAAGLWSTGGEAGKWQGFGGEWAKSDFGTIAFGTFAGGAGAQLSGVNFWQGAVTGLMVSGLNHAMNHIKQKITDKQLKKIYNAYPKGDANDPNYVSREDLFKQIGGPLEDWYNEDPSNPNLQNTCELRLSKALNDSGYTIPKSGNTYNGSNGKNYFLTVKNITSYLSKSSFFGAPIPLLSGQRMRNGIISQTNCGWTDATGHVDIIYRGKAGSQFHNKCANTSYWH